MAKEELQKMANEISTMLSGKQRHHRGKENGLTLHEILTNGEVFRFRSYERAYEKGKELFENGIKHHTRTIKYDCSIINEDLKEWYNENPIEDMDFKKFEKYVESHLN